jgi:homospermidine synthase
MSPTSRWSNGASSRRALYRRLPRAWQGGHTDTALAAGGRRSNYAHREAALALRSKYPAGPTAVLMHGANPGLVSHLVKQALLNLAGDLRMDATVPSERESWARLAARLQVKVIHVSERDHQTSRVHKRNGNSSTLVGGGLLRRVAATDRTRLGHAERSWPQDAREYGFGCGAASISTDRAWPRRCVPGRRSQGRSMAG